jgi:hypothetical protein
MTTVQTINYSAKTKTKNRMTANPSQNKKSCKATHKPTQFAAHFILPKRTQSPPTTQTDKFW